MMPQHRETRRLMGAIQHRIDSGHGISAQEASISYTFNMESLDKLPGNHVLREALHHLGISLRQREHRVVRRLESLGAWMVVLAQATKQQRYPGGPLVGYFAKTSFTNLVVMLSRTAKHCQVEIWWTSQSTERIRRPEYTSHLVWASFSHPPPGEREGGLCMR